MLIICNTNKTLKKLFKKRINKSIIIIIISWGNHLFILGLLLLLELQMFHLSSLDNNRYIK
jgi:hypothetical protein